MGLEQYAGMSLEEKVTVILVKQDNIENLIAAKPCPSPQCIRCQADVADLKLKEAERATREAAEAASEQDDQEREAWVVPMWAMVITTVISVATTVVLAIGG